MNSTITGLPPGLLGAVAFVLGAVVGSFLNVVIARLPKMLEARWRAEARAYLELPEEPTSAPFNLAVPASHCPHCQHRLAWYDNLPLLSWLGLRGRCRYCGAAIGWRYFLVELVTALLTVAVVLRFGMGWHTLAALGLVWTLVALAAIDARTQLLPDDLTLPLLWAGLLFNLSRGWVPLPDAVIGAVAGYLILWSVYWAFKLATGKEGMGYGDFKLAAALGAWLGWAALPAILLLAAGVGALWGIAARLSGALASGQPMPFGPFLALAGIVLLLWPSLGRWLGLPMMQW